IARKYIESIGKFNIKMVSRTNLLEVNFFQHLIILRKHINVNQFYFHPHSLTVRSGAILDCRLTPSWMWIKHIGFDRMNER
ncbi:MAG: hypothetical protein AAFY21_02260, partial [Cyanobacteria bacterium J06641_2]